MGYTTQGQAFQREETRSESDGRKRFHRRLPLGKRETASMEIEPGERFHDLTRGEIHGAAHNRKSSTHRFERGGGQKDGAKGEAACRD